MPPGTSAIAFDRDYRRYALSDAKGAISVFRFGDDRPIVRLPGLGRPLEALLLSPDGRFVAGFSSGELQVWAVDGGRPVFPQPVPARCPSRFQRGQQPVGGRSARRLDRRVGPGDGPGDPAPAHRESPRHAFAFHPDGRQLAVGYGEHAAVVEVWDTDSGKKVTELPAGDAGSVCALAWHPDGRRLAIGFDGPTGRVQIWDAAERRALATLEGHAQWVGGMAFHPGGDLLVTVSGDGTSRLWDARTGRPLVNWPAGIGNLHFSRDGTVCGFAGIGGRVRLMEVADGREYRTLVSSLGAGRGEYREGDISADGLLAVGMDDGVRALGPGDRPGGRLPARLGGRTRSASSPARMAASC